MIAISKQAKTSPPKDPNNLVCSTCLEEKPKEAFYKTTNYYCDGRGYTYVCKECSRASARRSALKKKQGAVHDAKGEDDGLCTAQEETTRGAADRVCSGPSTDVR